MRPPSLEFLEALGREVEVIGGEAGAAVPVDGSTGEGEVGVARHVHGEGVREGAHEQGELLPEVLDLRREGSPWRCFPIPIREGKVHDAGISELELLPLCRRLFEIFQHRPADITEELPGCALKVWGRWAAVLAPDKPLYRVRYGVYFRHCALFLHGIFTHISRSRPFRPAPPSNGSRRCPIMRVLEVALTLIFAGMCFLQWQVSISSCSVELVVLRTL